MYSFYVRELLERISRIVEAESFYEHVLQSYKVLIKDEIEISSQNTFMKCFLRYIMIFHKILILCSGILCTYTLRNTQDSVFVLH